MNVTIELLALDRNAWEQLAEAPAVFAAEHALALGAEPDLLRAVGQQTVALLERTGATTPWTGYLAVEEVMDPEAGPVWRWDRPRLRGEP